MVAIENYEEIKKFLKTRKYPTYLIGGGNKSNFRRKCDRFHLRRDDLYLKDMKIVLDKEERISLIKTIHEGGSTCGMPLGSHIGITKTFNILNKRFFWGGFYNDIKDFIGACPKCQIINKCVSLNPLPFPTEKWVQIDLDICLLPVGHGYKYIAIAIDYYSKWCEIKPLNSKTGIEIAKFLYSLMCRYGCHDVALNDPRKRFVDTVAQIFYGFCGIRLNISSAYHPQTNSLIEKINRTIHERLLKIGEGNEPDLNLFLEGVLFSYNTTPHSTTKLSPYELMFDKKPKLSIDFEFHKDRGNDDQSIKEEMDEKYENSKSISDSLNIGKLRQKYCYGMKDKNKIELIEGMKVLINNARRRESKAQKCCLPFNGPYLLKSIQGNGLCELIDEKGNVVSQKVNVNNLRVYNESEPKDEIMIEDELHQLLEEPNELQNEFVEEKCIGGELERCVKKLQETVSDVKS